MSHFGTQLRRHRVARSLTQKDLGTILGVSQEAITNYENGGRFPRAQTLQAMSRYFAVSLDELLSSPGTEATPMAGNTGQLLDLLKAGDLEAAYVYADGWKTTERWGLADLYQTAYLPVLVTMGDQWQQGRLSVAEEHVLTGLIRELLFRHAAAQVPVSGPATGRWFGLCAPGETHDLVLLMLSLVLRNQGWETWFLGSNVPTFDLLSLVEKHQPHVLTLTLTLAEHRESLLLLARAVRRQFGASPAILVGGNGWRASGTPLPPELDAFALSLVQGVELAKTLRSKNER